MKLGELAVALDKHGVTDVGRRTLYSYITKGLENSQTGKMVRMRAAKRGRLYHSTIIWACEFLSECDAAESEAESE